MKAIINGRIVCNDQVLEEKALIFGGKIVDVISSNELERYDIEDLYDAKGCYITAGFIDIHTHGGHGHDVMDGDVGAIRAMSKAKAKHGVTGFLPTTMTMDFGYIEKAIDSVENAKDKIYGARVLGCHLEGPFISSQNAGAQSPKDITAPDFKKIDKHKEYIKIVTIAPEVDGAQQFIQKCVDNNIVVSLGHSAGGYEDAMRAIENGAESITHIFNAMPPLHHREPGIIGAALDSDVVYCELIADNIHVHPVAQRVLFKTKGIDKIILITDAMRACEMSEGIYELGGQRVIVKDRRARLENGTLAGSILTMDNALKNFRQNTGTSVVQTVRTVTENPAKLLKIFDDYGSIEAGKVSDIAVFDEHFAVRYTFVDGNLYFENDSIEHGEGCERA